MKENYNIGRWELGCLVFNSLVYKIFTKYPEKFFQTSGSAGWVTAVYAGIVFLLFLAIVLKLYTPFSNVGIVEALKLRNKNRSLKIVSSLAIIYFTFSLLYALISVCSALKVVSYVASPVWFTGLFLLLAPIVAVSCGGGAVFRIHSLSVLGIGIAALTIALFSFKYADIYNLAPILGSGAENAFGRGLKTLFIYLDILVIFFLPKKDGNFSYSKTVFISSLLAVLLNIIVVVAISLNSPYELAQKISLPIYPLTKTSAFGKVPLRLDTIYHTAMIVSVTLYISLALSILVKLIKGLSIKAKKIAASALCILLCLSLCGCFDHSEVEENAYVIALGIDKGENERFKYTFQISNPLESGGSIGAEEKATEQSESSDNKNKTVDNIIIEANDYRIATDKLKSILSKDARLSHMKLIVCSFDVAREGMLEHSELLLYEREIRPGSNLCLSASASDYLTSVKPTLEESTARYYELLFRSRDVPYAPLTELRDFVGRSLDTGYDAVIPIAGDSGLSGMGIFSDGNLMAELNDKEVLIYKMICGQLNGAAFLSGDKSYLISNRKNTKISADFSQTTPVVNITVYLRTADNNTLPIEVVNSLSAQAEELLYKTASLNCDIFGFGRKMKRKCLTQSRWESVNFDDILKRCKFNLRILP